MSKYEHLLDITVCILSYKRPHFLAEAIESVLAQTKKPKGFIVFDNGSGGRTGRKSLQGSGGYL